MHPDFVCVFVRRRRFALMCVGNKMMRHVFLYLSCFDLVACSFSCKQWLDILKHGFWWNLYCVGVGLPMPLDCYRALRAYICPFVMPVQWRTAAFCRSYEEACSSVLCKAFSHYKQLIHRVADNDLHHYAFYKKRNTASVMKKYCKAFSQGMCKSHMPTDASPGASDRTPLRFRMGKNLLQIMHPLKSPKRKSLSIKPPGLCP